MVHLFRASIDIIEPGRLNVPVSKTDRGRRKPPGDVVVAGGGFTGDRLLSGGVDVGGDIATEPLEGGDCWLMRLRRWSSGVTPTSPLSISSSLRLILCRYSIAVTDGMVASGANGCVPRGVNRGHRLRCRGFRLH